MVNHNEIKPSRQNTLNNMFIGDHGKRADDDHQDPGHDNDVADECNAGDDDDDVDDDGDEDGDGDVDSDGDDEDRGDCADWDG